MSVELDWWVNWLFLALAVLALLVLLCIGAAFYVVYVIDRFFNWLDARLFLALTILACLILLSMCALAESMILRAV